MLTAIGLLAWAHPNLPGHLHEPVAACDDAHRVRRAGALADDGQVAAALVELDAVCAPDDETVRVARARALLMERRGAEALAVLDGVVGPDADVWRARAAIVEGRDDDAGRWLAGALPHLPAAPPQLYLDAAARLPPPDASRVLTLGIERLGPVGELARALARAEAAAGRVDTALAWLRPDRPADRLLAGDLLLGAGRSSEARDAWQAGLLALPQRPSPAAAAVREALLTRLAAP
jgi:predicted negative regulator of RcsB-dependent stress response